MIKSIFSRVTFVCEQKEDISMEQEFICIWLEGSSWARQNPFSKFTSLRIM